MEKLQKFGLYLIAFNFAYCLVMAAIDSYTNGGYVFTSQYFYGGSLLLILAINIDSYITRNKKTESSSLNNEQKY